MAKTFDQYLAESGKQSTLDTLRKEGTYDRAKSQYASTGTFTGLKALPTPTRRPSSPGQRLALGGGKDYGGWYNNPSAGGKNQRYWGTDAGGKEIWTDGDEPGLPKSSEEVTPYLNNFQNNVFGSGSGRPVIADIPTPDELKKRLRPETELPALLDRKGAYENYRIEFGLEDLETALNDLKGQEEDEEAYFRAQRFTEEGKPVPLNVIAGRVGEEERQAKERLDFIGRQKSRIIDELNTKYTIIGQFMEFENLDYNDAVDRYQDEFTRNVQVFDMISGLRKEERSAFESDRDAARANLQIYMNAITAGNIDPGSMSGDQRIMISKLEAQAGLPIGFMAQVKRDPGSDIVFTSTNKGVTQVGIRNADGTISVQSYGTPTGDGGGTGGTGTAKSVREDFLDEVSTTEGRQVGDQWQGIFPQMVFQYANRMTLQAIYRAYQSSDVGKEFGTPSEDPAEIEKIYDSAKGR